LPKNLLPVCRWWFKDILDIAEMFAKGISAYAIAKSLDVSLASLLNLQAWLQRATVIVEELIRENGPLDQLPPRPAPSGSVDVLKLAERLPSWSEFTFAFSRTLYPKRFSLRSTYTILTG
jgi:hypothetical protein